MQRSIIIIAAAAILGLPAAAHAIPITVHEKVIGIEKAIDAEVVRGDPIVGIDYWLGTRVKETVVHVAPADDDEDGVATADDPCPQTAGSDGGCPPPVYRSSGTGGYSGDGAHSSAVSGYSLEYPSMVECESGGNPNVYSPDGTYWGLGQFDQQTWDAYAPSGEWGSATPAEQIAAIEAVPYDAWPNC